MDKQDSNWRKASFSNGSGDCVEVGHTANVVVVRDTKDRVGGTLTFTADAWRVFATGISRS
jgi:hypothetical protein